MYGEVLKFGAQIVDALVDYKLLSCWSTVAVVGGCLGAGVLPKLNLNWFW